ncbi:MAG: GTPase Era [Alicyclobacillaceae bacterium]|uniref:GTPase Era n=1 Tax=Alicyclobacillus sp. SP_1 TaxID=2942475 RepID=UPI002157E331|nr:GTPase Era [Alicyclobacillus sp. SP_1]MCY0888474.1 GTPase Era [Alicyclobacillaceae bacterium]MCY0895184.1 GTPase Era [Alicyclobacillaceae bacterium]
MEHSMDSFRSGFVAIVGRPNVGKSTLLNHLIGQKVAIMSNRAQTTRNAIRGVMTRSDAQVIFIDTPGIHQPKHLLGERMMDAALQTLQEVDVVLMVVDATESGIHKDAPVLELLKDVTTPVYLVLNKVDRIKKEQLLPLIASYHKARSFQEVIPVSALTGTQLDELVQLIVEALPVGPKYYPDGMVTDHPEAFIIAEMVREKVLHLTREEIPHSIMVDIESMERRSNGTLYVNAIIYTERTSQKGILIGKDGAMLKRVGELARHELERLLGMRMFLELWVKVKKDWRNEPSMLRRIGLSE